MNLVGKRKRVFRLPLVYGDGLCKRNAKTLTGGRYPPPPGVGADRGGRGRGEDRPVRLWEEGDFSWVRTLLFLSKREI